jgi:dTDP-4-amino-4,6-dideoxygalactose transaminase
MAKDYEMPGEVRTWGVYVPDEAIKRVTEVLKTGWLNTGKNEKLLRETFCERFGAKYCVAVNNGTAALRATYSMLGIGPGDEVVTTPYTFIATNTAILEQGATPVFADVRYEDLNITAESIEKKLTWKTKAIVVVHYAGNPVDLDEIRALAKYSELPLIEDSAHAIGSRYKDKYIGETGELVTFSLQAVKIVTAGDGGLIVTNKEKYYSKLKEKIWYGIDRDNKQTNLFYDPLPDDITTLGFKYNMNDIIASLGVSAINNFDKPFSWRQYIGEQYRKELGNLNKIKLLKYYSDREPNYQIFPVHVKKRKEFAQFMWDAGIQVVVNNRRNDKYSIFGGKQRDLTTLDIVDKDVILLPIHYDLSDTEMNKVIDKVREYDKL